MEINRETPQSIANETSTSPKEIGQPTTINPQAESSAQQTAAMPIAADRLIDLLRSYGYQVTEQNMEMLAMMTEQGIPLTKENVAKMNQALKLTDSQEKALFLFENGIRLTQGNAAQLNQLLEGFKITDAIQNLLNSLSEMNDPPLAARLMQILERAAGGETPAQNQAQPAAPAAGSAGSLVAGENHASANVANPSTTAPLAQAAPNATAAPVMQPMQTSPPTAAQAVIPATEQPMPAAAPIVTSGTDTPSPGMTQTQATEGQPNPNNTTAPVNPTQPTPAAREGLDTPQIAKEAIKERNTEVLRTLTTGKNSVETTAPRLSLPLSQDSKPQEVSSFIKQLSEALQEMKSTLTATAADSPAAARVLQEVQTLANQLDFMSQIKNPLFVQIPFIHEGREMQAELHVLRNNKKKENTGSSGSALIALDTACFGLFETFVQKNTRAITCQFRLRDKQVEQMVRANIHKLDALLREKQYSLQTFSFLPQGEPYTVLDSPKLAEETASVDVRAFDRKA